MNCALVSAVRPLAAQFAIAAEVDQDVGRTVQWLFTLDRIIFGLAAVVMVAGATWWLCGARADPLRASPARPNRLREDALAVAVLAYLVAALVLSGVARIFTGDKDDTLGRVLVGSGAQLAGLAVCLGIAAARFQGGLSAFWFGSHGGGVARAIGVTFFLTLLAMAICPLVLEGSIRALRQFVPAHEFPPHPTITALHADGRSLALTLTLWLGAVLIAPVAEEAFFRGLLQTLLVNTLRSRWAAIGVTAIVFAVIHISQPQAIPALLVLALLIGYAYERTGALLGPIFIHALFNLKTLVWDAVAALPP